MKAFKGIFAPLNAIVFYLTAVFLLFTFSVWNWNINNYELIFIIYFSSIVFIIFGYRRGVYISKCKKDSDSQFFKNDKAYANKILLPLMILFLLTIYPRAIYLHNDINLTVSEFLSRLFIGLYDSSLVYFIRSSSDSSVLKSLFHPITFLVYAFTPLVNSVVPLGVYFYFKLSLKNKILLILCILLHILLYVSIGTNKGLFDLLISFLFIRLLGIHGISKATRKFLILNNAIFVFLLFFTLNFFSDSILKRKSDDISTSDFTQNQVLPTSTIKKILPQNLSNVYISLDFYLTHGFYNLDKALEKKWEWTYFVGNSEFLMSVSDNLLGDDYVKSRTFERKLERTNKFYSIGKYWTTAFTALANDFHWLGVGVIIFIMSYYFGIITYSSMHLRHLFDIPLYILLVSFFLYLPLNNSLFSNFESLLSLVFYSAIRLIKK